jgi:hypothetical protein
MCRLLPHTVLALLMLGAALPLTGCGTTRFSDTNRTATEQLLISDAIDRAVQSVNVQSLAGQTVFLDDSRLTDVVDRNYLVSTLRQHLLANGCLLREKREDADFVVEARAGAVGTDRNDLLFGIPSMNVPQILPMQPVPAAIPEVPVAKRRHQRGVVKLAVFAYHRETGTPVWQSGVALQESSANDVWILGAGPFQRGTIHQGTEFAGKTLGTNETDINDVPTRLPPVDLARESVFASPGRLAKKPQPAADGQTGVVQAEHSEPQPSAQPPAGTASEPKSATPAGDGASTAVSPAPPAAPAAAPPPPNSVYEPADSAPLPKPRFDAR